jgi:hypothetical protein
VPPVLSSAIPIMAPRIIRKPIELMVLPKPSLIVLIIVFAGSTVNARKRETIKRAMKAFSLSFEVSRMIARILTITRKDKTVILIVMR